MGAACGKVSNEAVVPSSLPTMVGKNLGTEHSQHATLTSLRGVRFTKENEHHEITLRYAGKASQSETKDFIINTAFCRNPKTDTTFKAYSLYQQFFQGDLISMQVNYYTEMDHGYHQVWEYIDITFEKISFADLILLLKNFPSSGRFYGGNLRLISEDNVTHENNLFKFLKSVFDNKDTLRLREQWTAKTALDTFLEMIINNVIKSTLQNCLSILTLLGKSPFGKQRIEFLSVMRLALFNHAVVSRVFSFLSYEKESVPTYSFFVSRAERIRQLSEKKTPILHKPDCASDNGHQSSVAVQTEMLM